MQFGSSREDSFGHFCGLHTGKAVVEALEFIGETFVVDSETVEQGGLQPKQQTGILSIIVVPFQISQRLFERGDDLFCQLAVTGSIEVDVVGGGRMLCQAGQNMAV
jgi:hypothetical protein